MKLYDTLDELIVLTAFRNFSELREMNDGDMDQ
jgi:hypothetical protein